MSAEMPLPGPDVAEAFAAALHHHQAGRLSEAEAIYRTILVVDPGHAATHDALGNTLTAKGELAEARARYECAIELRPDFAEAHYHLGNLLLGQGMVTDARARYDRAIALKPDFAAALHARWHTTAFFRDPDVFELLESRICAQLNAAVRAGAKMFRVWIPACSTGQEVYSLAIVISEVLAGMPTAPAVELIGTDISTNALRRARAAYYRGPPPGTISEQRVKRFFVPLNDGYQVCDSVRQMCTFCYHDLTKNPAITDLDFISCRNVLSFFFGPELRDSIFQSFHAALKPGGWLILGKGETLAVPEALFRASDPDRMIFTVTSRSSHTPCCGAHDAAAASSLDNPPERQR